MISDGNLDARINFKRKDELGQLGLSFNNMANSIQEKIFQLNDKNEKMSLELKTAGEVQKSIYPLFRESDLFKIAIFHKPLMEVSGDYHDIFKLNNDSYGFLVTDVSGHGVSAALITVLIKNLFQKASNNFNNSKDLIVYINTELKNLMSTYKCFFTAFYLIIDSQKNINFSNASHPGGYLIRGKNIYRLTTEGAPIGITENVNEFYESKNAKVRSKDKIVIITDGVVESFNESNEQYSARRLKGVIVKNNDSNCEYLLNAILDDFKKFIDIDNLQDDFTLMIIEIK
jgi:sigma-B regulation protein RsbU (phosphoserine phosphatase)